MKEQIASFPKISPHELIDHTVWPLEGVKVDLRRFEELFLVH